MIRTITVSSSVTLNTTITRHNAVSKQIVLVEEDGNRSVAHIVSSIRLMQRGVE